MSLHPHDMPSAIEKRYRGLVRGWSEEQRLGAAYWTSFGDRLEEQGRLKNARAREARASNRGVEQARG